MDNGHHDGKHFSILVIAYLVVIAVGILTVVIALPDISSSIQESGMLELIQQRLNAPTTEPTKQYGTVVFALPTSEGISYREILISITGSKPYHETIEHLLSGPNYQALTLGSISYIPKGTRLLGLTVSQRVAYVDLSKEFLSGAVTESKEFDIAKEQINRTLRSFSSIRDTVILVEGEKLQ